MAAVVNVLDRLLYMYALYICMYLHLNVHLNKTTGGMTDIDVVNDVHGII